MRGVIPKLERWQNQGVAATSCRLALGCPQVDEPLGGGLPHAALHEVFAATVADAAAATGFAAALALRAAGSRHILWVRHDAAEAETGRLHPPGLQEFGLSPARMVLVRARDALGVLRAGAEAARCRALGAALIEPWGEPGRLDLTVSRRLALAAQGSGVLTLMLRVGARPQPSAAATRWLVRATPSRPLEAQAPGPPAFALTLLRHRGGVPVREWRLEWNRDRGSFQPAGSGAAAGIASGGAALSGAVVSLSRREPAGEAAGEGAVRRAG